MLQTFEELKLQTDADVLALARGANSHLDLLKALNFGRSVEHIEHACRTFTLHVRWLLCEGSDRCDPRSRFHSDPAGQRNSDGDEMAMEESPGAGFWLRVWKGRVLHLRPQTSLIICCLLTS